MRYLKTYKIFESSTSNPKEILQDIKDILLDIDDYENVSVSICTALKSGYYDGESDNQWFKDQNIDINSRQNFGKSTWDLEREENLVRLPDTLFIALESDEDDVTSNTNLYMAIKENKDDIQRVIDYLKEIGYELYEMCSYGYHSDSYCKWGEGDTIDKLLAHSEVNGWLKPGNFMYTGLSDYQFRFKKI